MYSLRADDDGEWGYQLSYTIEYKNGALVTDGGKRVQGEFKRPQGKMSPRMRPSDGYRAWMAGYAEDYGSFVYNYTRHTGRP